MPIGSSLGITLPSQGGNSGTWGTDLNTELQKVIDAVEAQVPASAIDFSADFDLNGNALTSVAHVSMDAQGSAPGELRSAYFDSNGDFWVRDGDNATVQITSSGSLNNASAGGLGDSGGTYGTSNITFDWDGTKYNARDGAASTDYADVKMKDCILVDDSTGNAITVDVPALAGSYSFTLPSAVPGSNSTLLQSDTSGNTSFSNTLSQDITLSGTAEVKHGARVVQIHAASGAGDGGYSNSTKLWSLSASQRVDFGVPLKVGDRITSVTIKFNGSTVSNKTARLVSRDDADTSGGGITVEASNTSGTSGEGSVTITHNHVVATGEHLIIDFLSASDATTDRVLGVEITYDRP